MIVIMRKEKSIKVCRRIEMNHFDGLLKKKANIAFVQNHIVLLILIEYENKLGVVHVARDIFIFQEDNATVHITEHS